MKSPLNYIVSITAGIITAGVMLYSGTVFAQTFCFPADGCTGTSTAPTYGQLLVGNSGGTYTLTATSSLGISSSSGGSGTISTSTVPTVGQLAYWTSAAFPSLLGSVATSSPVGTYPLQISGAGSLIGAATTFSLAFGTTTANTWADTQTFSTDLIGAGIQGTELRVSVDGGGRVNFTNTANTVNYAYLSSTGSNSQLKISSDGVAEGAILDASLITTADKTFTFPDTTGTLCLTSTCEAPLTFSFPLTRTTNAISWSGLATSSPLSAGLLYATGVNTMASVSTSTAVQMSITGLAGTATALAANGANCSAGNYPLGIDASGAVEDCTAIGASGSAYEIATTSDIAVPNLAYFTKTSGRTTLGSVATTTPSFGLGLTGGGTWNVLGSAPTLSIATSSLFSGTIGQFPYFTGTNTLAGTSTLSIATNGTLTIDNGLAGDASTQYGATSHEWTVGYDATDYSFAIASSTALGTSNALTIDKTTLYTTLVGLTLTNDLTVANGGTGASTLTGILIGNGASAFTAIAGNTCTNQFLRAFTSSGGTCASVANADLTNSTISGVALGSNLADLTATNSSLTFSGTYNGGTARTIGLNLANENSWTGGQTFANATSTGTFTLPVGASVITPLAGNMAIDTTTGQLRYSDVNGTTRVLSSYLYPAFSFPSSPQMATTTTATTTVPLGTAFVGETWDYVECYSGAGTVGYQFTDGTNAMDYRTATTTVSRFTLSTNNAFTVGEKRSVSIGPMTASYLSCTLRKTITSD